MANALLRPAPIINRMVGLDGGNHVKLGEAVEVLGCHVLCMLDAETAVSLAMGFRHFRVQVKNDRDPLVADGMRAELKASSIGLNHALAHERERRSEERR